MKIVKYNDGWKQWVDKDSFAMIWGIPEDAKEVRLPHDAMLEKRASKGSLNGRSSGFRDGEVYHYVKMLKPDIHDRSKTMMIKFEGIYMNAMVYVNGQMAAKCSYGYTGFYVLLNDYLKYGEENEIRVIVRNNMVGNSRWYSGGGIYRDVYFLTSEEVYIEPEGVQSMTENLHKDSAVLKIKTALRNRSSRRRELRLITEIVNREGEKVAISDEPIILFEGECRDVECRIVVDKPFLWNAENPYLYSVYSKIYEDGVQLDEQVDTIGIRTLSVDAKHGYCINGKPVKFRGACIHHDCGILGAATFYDAEYRRVRILKESGFNAIRSAHQPAAPALLRACDELGMYVMDEAFDMWTRCKSDNDYGLFFGECWEKDIELMVKKDFNHPSVVMYSIGNEIPETGTDHGAKLCYDIAEKIKKLDGSRYTLAAINGIFASGDVIPQILNQIMEEKPNTEGNVNNFMAVMDANINHIVVHDEVSKRLEKACANVDIAGYNYMSARYEGDGKKYPNRIIVGSETYPSDIAPNWELVNKLNYVIGDFTWTGWDYIGEAGIGVPAYQPGDGGFDAKFPCQLAYCGDIDLTGHRRPASYYREIVYGLRKKPYIAVQNPYRHGEEIIKTPWIISDTLSSWSYPKMEGKPIVVEVYSAGDEVELLINGKSQGRRRSGRETGYITVFETVYEVGEIEAITWEKGVELGREKVCTAGANTRLIFEIEEGPESELIYVNIKNVDCNGILATQEVRTIKCEIEGQADIWFGSGNPKPQNNYLDAVTQTWNGKALLIVRKRNNAQVKLHIERETLII